VVVVADVAPVSQDEVDSWDAEQVNVQEFKRIKKTLPTLFLQKKKLYQFDTYFYSLCHCSDPE